jgi:hypothetical protein
MNRFFRTTSWQLEPLLASWVLIAMSSFPIPEFNGHLLLIGDTLKVGKEAFKIPGLKLLHPELLDELSQQLKEKLEHLLFAVAGGFGDDQVRKVEKWASVAGGEPEAALDERAEVARQKLFSGGNELVTRSAETPG